MNVQSFVSSPSRTVPILLSSLLTATLFFSLSPQMANAQQYSMDAIHSYNQGIEAYDQGRPSDALRKFNKATQLDPNYAAAYFNMGSIYYQMNQYDEASNMFQKAVNLTPGDSQAKYNLALCLEKLMRKDEAVTILSQIPPSDSKYGQAHAKIEELRPSLKPAIKGKRGSRLTAAEKASAATAAVNTGEAALVSQTFSKGYDGPTGLVIGPGGFMYIANYSKNMIYRVGAGGEKTVFASGTGIKGPIGLVYNAKTNELYAANYLLNNIIRINTNGKTSVLVSGLTKPYNLFLDTVNNTLYVSEQDPANLISKIVLPNTQ